MNEKTKEVQELANAINEILNGRSMEIVGTVLITMVAVMVNKVSKTDRELDAGLEAIRRDTVRLATHIWKEGIVEGDGGHHVH